MITQEMIDRFEKAVRANGYRTCDDVTEKEYQAAKATITAALALVLSEAVGQMHDSGDGFGVRPIWFGSTPPHGSHIFAAPVPQPVQIKALEWREHPNSFPAPLWTAQTPFGFYNLEEISASDSPAYEVRLHAHHFVAGKESLDEAKAAAQADYESRIRSALSSPPSDASEIAALREKVAMLEEERDGLVDDLADAQQEPWPEWASSILKTLQANGYDPVDSDGTVDLADAFNDYLEGINQADEAQRKALEALRVKNDEKTELLGYANVYRMQGGSFELGGADIDNLEDVHPWAIEFEEHVGVAEIRLLPDTDGKSGSYIRALQQQGEGK